MAKRIGLIQTRGIGDIIIAIPIADFYIEQGCEVFWPIDEAFVEMFSHIKPSINFLGVTRPATPDHNYFLQEPLRLLTENECERTIALYSYLGGMNLADPRLAHSLKFDEYKYAIAGVPFERISKTKKLFSSIRLSPLHLFSKTTGVSFFQRSSKISWNFSRPRACRVIETEEV